MKGIAWLPIVVILMVVSSITVASIYFVKSEIFQKRAFEEEILARGNEIETYSHIVGSTTDLASIQAIHDIGKNVILAVDVPYYYDSTNPDNPSNFLPFWTEVPVDKIKSNILRFSRIYFNNYVESVSDYLDDVNEEKENKWLDAIRSIEWDPFAEFDAFEEDNILTNYGSLLMSYSSERIELIDRDVAIQSKIKTKFMKTLEIGQEVINRILALVSTVKQGSNTFSNGNSIDFSSEGSSDIRIEIVPPSEYKKICCSLGDFFSWYDGEDCPSLMFPSTECGGCGVGCSPIGLGTLCTCTTSQQNILNFEPPAKGVKVSNGVDCRDSSLSYSDGPISVKEDDKICIITKEHNPNSPPHQSHTVKLRVTEVLDNKIKVSWIYKNNTIIHEYHLEQLKNDLAGYFASVGLGEIIVDLNLGDGFVDVHVFEPEQRAVYDIRSNNAVSDTIGLRFLVNTSIPFVVSNPSSVIIQPPTPPIPPGSVEPIVIDPVIPAPVPVDDIYYCNNDTITESEKPDICSILTEPLTTGLQGLAININFNEQFPPIEEISGLQSHWVRTILYSTYQDFSNGANVRLDETLERYAGTNTRILVVVNHETLGRAPPPHGSPEWSEYIDDFSNLVGKIAARYGPLGVGIEVWNEPDLVGLHPDDFVAIQKASYKAAKKVSSTEVIMGGVASSEWVSYLDEVVKKLKYRYYDGIGFHPYGKRIGSFPAPDWGSGDLEDSIRTAYYIGAKPIWITEFGVPLQHVDNPGNYGKSAEEMQAEYLTRAYQLFNNLGSSIVKTAFWFAWDDRTHYDPIGESFGLVHQNHAHRLSWTAFSNLAT